MNIAIAIESSNSRGMGHLFRALQYVDFLKQKNINFTLLINNDPTALSILNLNKINYVIVNYGDLNSNWEQNIIKSNNITVWFNDKFTTTISMAKHVKDAGAYFICIDDVGEGAYLSDLYFAGMIYPTLQKGLGKKNYCGREYVVLSKELDLYKRSRNEIKRIVITMGGSDPHEVTEDLIKEFKKYEYDVSVVIGPSYKRKFELECVNDSRFKIYQNLESLFSFLYNFDLAVTGGGGTCCEAAAMGLPTMIIANAPHEINTGRSMEKLGVSVFLGDHSNWSKSRLKDIENLNIEKMSTLGINLFDTKAVERIFDIILKETSINELL